MCEKNQIECLDWDGATYDQGPWKNLWELEEEKFWILSLAGDIPESWLVKQTSRANKFNFP